MDIPLSIILLLIALLFSLFSGIIVSLSNNELQVLSQINQTKADKLKQIRNDFDNNLKSYYFYELLFSVAAYVLLAFKLFYQNWQLLPAIFLIICVSAVYFFLHNIIYAYGERKSNRFALRFFFWLNSLHKISLPIFKFLNFIISLIKGRDSDEESRQEIHELFETAREEGSLNDKEYMILTNIMNFSEILVSDVMTPHTVIFSCNANSEVKDILDFPQLQIFSRFPIWEGESIDDRVIGYVLTKDVFKAALNHQEEMKLKEYARDVYFIPETASVSAALEKFLQRRQHLFVVVDEYGGVSGLLSMEDVLETILGQEIMDEADKISDLRKYATERRNERVNLISSKF